MDVGIDARSAVGNRSGVGNYLLNVIQAGAFEGHTVYAYYDPEDGEPPDVTVPRTTLRWRPVPKDWFSNLLGPAAAVGWVNVSLRRALRTDSVDCFFGPNFVQPVGLGLPSVVVVHDLIHRICPSAHPLLYRLYLRTFLSLSLRSADHVLTVSANTKRDLRHFHDVPSGQITITYPAADERFRPRELPEERIAVLRDVYDLPESFILYVGNIEPRKNLSTLVRAMRHVSDDIRCPLVIVGQKHVHDPEFEQLLAEDWTDELIHRTGYVPDEDLPLLYNLATIFTYPSLYEGFGIPPLEAMQSGTPVIVSDRGSLSEVVGDAGITVNPMDELGLADALERLLTDRSVYRKYQQRGLERAADLSWNQTAARVSTVLESKMLSGGS